MSTDHDGLAAFVPLDYTTIGGNDARFEHAVIMLPQHWDSMFELIREPGVFIDAWQKRYAKTPDHYHDIVKGRKWSMTGPITIVIEPLAVQSPANIAILCGLSGLYSDLIPVLADWRKLPPSVFQDKVVAACNNPAGDWDMEVVKEVATEITRGGKTIVKKTLESFVLPLSASKRFPLQYVAEFAIKTRTLRIKYVARGQGAPSGKGAWPITLTTINPVQNLDLTYLHFDIDFASGHTPNDVASARAWFAMQFIGNPHFIDSLTKAREKSNTYEAVQATSPFTPTDPTLVLPLSQTIGKVMPRIRGVGLARNPAAWQPQPSVMIDSVWPIVPKTSAVSVPLCCLLTGQNMFQLPGNTTDWWYESEGLLIKAYSIPAGGIVNPGSVGDKSNSNQPQKRQKQ